MQKTRLFLKGQLQRKHWSRPPRPLDGLAVASLSSSSSSTAPLLTLSLTRRALARAHARRWRFAGGGGRRCRGARTGGRGLGRSKPRPSTVLRALATSPASRGSCGRTLPSSTTRIPWCVRLSCFFSRLKKCGLWSVSRFLMLAVRGERSRFIRN